VPDRNARKRNLKRSQAVALKRLEIQALFEELDKKPNKTPDQKLQLEKLKRSVMHLRLKEKQKSEPHARKGDRR
jgi:hypothetical protein